MQNHVFEVRVRLNGHIQYLYITAGCERSAKRTAIAENRGAIVTHVEKVA